VKTFADNLAVPHDDAADHWVWLNASLTAHRQSKRSLHEGVFGRHGIGE
jgi:hypothetical protein